MVKAKTPKPILQIEGEDARVDARMLKDQRVRLRDQRDFTDERLDQDLDWTL